MIICDTREKKNTHIINYFKKNKIDYEIRKIDEGDYMSDLNDKISVERKANLQEIMSNITQVRFKKELIRAKQKGIHLIILIEHGKNIKSFEDIKTWVNPRLSQYCFLIKKQLGIWGEYNHWELYRLAKERGFNPRRPPQDATQLMKSLQTIQANKEDYDCEFIFCEKSESASKIIEILSA